MPINPDAIRQLGVLSGFSAPTDPYGAGMTRREMIAITSVGSIAAPTLIDAALSSHRLDVTGSSRRLAFLVDGIERWVIEPDRFEGAPQLKFAQGRRRISVALRGARYPGTGIPADLTAEIWRVATSWHARFDVAAAGGRAEVSFIRWLLSEIALERKRSAASPVATFPAGGGIELRANAITRFTPTWALEFSGRGIAHLAFGRRRLDADSCAVRLLDASEGSLANNPEPRRSVITIRRGGQAWNAQCADLGAAHGWDLREVCSAFDHAVIESGGRNHVGVLLPDDDRANFTFAPDARLTSSGAMVAIPLHLARLAFDGTEADAPATLLAALPSTGTVSLGCEKFALELCQPESPRRFPFELVERCGAVESLQCQPDLACFSVALPEAVIETGSLTRATTLPMSWESLRNDIQEATARLHFGSDDVRCELASYRTSILRPRDLLALDFELVNLDLVLGMSRAYLRPRKTHDGCKPLVIVHFPPQHIAEQAFFHTMSETPETGNEQPTPPPVLSRISGPTRLAFELPDSDEFPFTVDWLLDWSQWTPVVVPVAEVVAPAIEHDPAPTIRQPGRYETSIEAPYRLILSPVSGEHWQTSGPPNAEGRVELWMARLRRDANLRAVWSPDYAASGPCPGPYFPDQDACRTPGKTNEDDRLPFRMSLDRHDRHELVWLSAGLDKMGANGKRWPSPPIVAHTFMLSTLGAWLDVRGQWDPVQIANDTTCTLPVEAWKHRAAMGRDHFVQVVYSGFMFPFGHRAVLIKETERKMHDTSEGPVAYLRQRKYIVIKKPSKRYSGSETRGIPSGARAVGFEELHIETLFTPDLDEPCLHDIDGNRDAVFWPYVAGRPFEFDIRGVNRAPAGGPPPAPPVHFRIPLIFVDATTALNGCLLEPVFNAYTAARELATTQLHGQRVTMTEEKKAGETTLEVDRLEFKADHPAGPCEMSETEKNAYKIDEQPLFYPHIQEADVRVPSMAELSGSADTTTIAWEPRYLDHEFLGEQHGNPGEVFAKVIENQIPLKFPGRQSGGFATPSIQVQGLSRLAGPISGTPETFSQGQFDADKFFGALKDGAKAKLLGVIPLGELIQPLGDLQNQLDRIPRLLAEKTGVPIGDIENAFATVRSNVLEATNQIRQSLISSALLEQLRKTIDADPNITAARRRVDEVVDRIAKAGTEVDALLTEKAREEEALRLELEQAGNAFRRQWQEKVGVVEMVIDADLPTLPELDTLRKQIEEALTKPPGALTQDELFQLRRAFSVKAAEKFAPVLQRAQQIRERCSSLAELPLERAATRVIEELARSKIDADVIKTITRLTTAATELETQARSTLDDLAAITGRIQREKDEILTTLAKAKEDAEKTANDIAQQIVHDAENALQATAKATAKPYLDQVAQTVARVQNDVDAFVAAAMQTAVSQVDALLSNVASPAKDLLQRLGEAMTAVETAKKEIARLLQPRDLVVRYEIEPRVQDAPKDRPVFVTNPGTRFAIRTVLRKTIDLGQLSDIASAPTIDISADLENFRIVLFPGMEFLKLTFKELSLSSHNGETPRIGVKGVKVELGEALEFVKSLQDVLPFGKDKCGFHIDLGTDGIEIGYRFGIPGTTVGAFNLQSMSINAALILPLDGGEAMVRFSFCDFHRPFTLTSGIYGGGGFLAVTTTINKVIRLEGALEFGAATELSLGVANGNARIMAGIYFQSDDKRTFLTGYVRASGDLDILGYVRMVVDFYMGLTRDGSNVWGEARVKVSIDMRVHTIDVELHCRRDFAGGGGSQASLNDRHRPVALLASLDPSAITLDAKAIVPLINDSLPTEQEWDEYARAFDWR